MQIKLHAVTGFSLLANGLKHFIIYKFKQKVLYYFHTPTYALVSYIVKSALIIYIKTFYSLTAPTCFDT
jgi:hypothetical protein